MVEKSKRDRNSKRERKMNSTTNSNMCTDSCRLLATGIGRARGT